MYIKFSFDCNNKNYNDFFKAYAWEKFYKWIGAHSLNANDDDAFGKEDTQRNACFNEINRRETEK